MDLYIYIIGIIVCVMLSAFFSASEMSYSACNKVRLEHDRDNGNKKAGIAYKIADKFDDALSAILVGNNLVNIAASSMGSVAVMLVLSEKYAWVSTAAITVAVIIFRAITVTVTLSTLLLPAMSRMFSLRRRLRTLSSEDLSFKLKVCRMNRE